MTLCSCCKADRETSPVQIGEGTAQLCVHCQAFLAECGYLQGRALVRPVDEWLTIQEAAQEIGKAAGTLRSQISRGNLAAEKRGKTTVISRVALDEYKLRTRGGNTSDG